MESFIPSKCTPFLAPYPAIGVEYDGIRDSFAHPTLIVSPLITPDELFLIPSKFFMVFL